MRDQLNDEIKVIDAFCENLSKKALVDHIIKEMPDEGRIQA
ncbi:unnamed protein product, partial [marine sediment metagenome]